MYEPIEEISAEEAAADHRAMCEVIWDLYKDVNGIRPRHIDFESKSREWLADMIDSLERDLEVVMVRDREYLDWLEEQEAQERAAWLAEQQEARELEAVYPYGEYEYLEAIV